MEKRKKQKFEISYRCVPNDIQLGQAFGILSEHFYKNEKRIKGRLKEIKRDKAREKTCQNSQDKG